MSWLLLHGALGSADQFEPHLETLPLAQAYTFPHHGERADGAPFTIDQLAFEIRPALDEEMQVLGHSMGGYVALWLAARYNVRFKHIYCWGTKLDWSPEFFHAQARFLQPQIMEEKRPHIVKNLLNQHGIHWQALVQQTLKMMESLAHEEKLSDDDFRRITSPVTFLVGEGDRMVSLEEAERTAALIPNSRAVYLEEMGHDLPDAETMLSILQQYRLF